MSEASPNHELPPPAYTFHGHYERAVDAKGRFNLPFRFRRGGPEAGEEKYVVMRGPDGGLTVHPREVWLEAFNRLRASTAGSEQARQNFRIMSRSSQPLEPDGQGRVSVPVEMLRSVGIERRVAVVGVGSYMELWNPDELDRVAADDSALDEEFVNEFFR